MMRKATLALCLFLVPAVVSAQERVSRTNHEIGLWIGAANPLPGTRTDEVLDANIGAGLFYRINAPWVFHTEFGVWWAQFFSRTTQKLTMAPVYGALSYRLPFEFKIETFLKIGGGAAWLEVRPADRSGWDPLGYAGIEFSIPASRRLRVGLRLDYALVYEEHLDPPPEKELGYLLLLERGNVDARTQTEVFEIQNGEFFNFGLMVSFVL